MRGSDITLAHTTTATTAKTKNVSINQTGVIQCGGIARYGKVVSDMRRIDADKLGEVKFHSLPYTHITPSDVEAESYKRGWNDAIDSIIENAPTIEQRCEECEAFNKTRLLVPQPERKKGKWIPQDHNKITDMASTLVFYYPKCSECGHSGNYTNFCPRCGADMREDQDG